MLSSKRLCYLFLKSLRCKQEYVLASCNKNDHMILLNHARADLWCPFSPAKERDAKYNAPAPPE